MNQSLRVFRALCAVLGLLFAPLVFPAPAPSGPAKPAKPAIAAKPAVETAKPAPEPAKEAATPAGKSFLWEVKSKSATIHLFGTVHVGKKSFYPLSPAVEKAFAEAKELVVEADITDTSQFAEVSRLSVYAAPDSLDKHIPVALFERLEKHLERINIPVSAAKTLRPFMVAITLSLAEYSRLGFAPADGIDFYLISNAVKTKKPVGQLESAAEQLKLMFGMPEDLQEAMLENAMISAESGKVAEQILGMIDAWQAGDAARVQTIFESASKGQREIERFNNLLLHSRNGRMLEKIERYLAVKEPAGKETPGKETAGKETTFIAVGALHLAGPRGLVELLKQKGYEVTQK